MDRTGLDRIFEWTLAEPEETENADFPALNNALVSALMRQDADTTEEFYELDAAQDFLRRVAAENSPVPPGFVAAAVAEYVGHAREPTAARRVWGLSRQRAIWAGGAIAATVLAAIIGMRVVGGDRVASSVARSRAAVVSLQASNNPSRSGNRSAIADIPPAPPAPKSSPLISGKDFNNRVPPPPAPRQRLGTQPLEPVYTAPNPPLALSSHAVTGDDYPPDSLRLQEQGSVRLKYTIQTDGNVGDCILTMTSGFPRLDEAACILVKKWKFKPATVIGGTPVAVTVPAEIVYALAPINPPPASRGGQFLFDGLVRRRESPH